jgi:hypothetical protein
MLGTLDRKWAVGAAMVIASVAAGCGGDDSESSGGIDALEESAGVDIDLDDDGGSIEVEGEVGGVQVGGNLETPDWVPAGFPLPADLTIDIAGSDGEVNELVGSTSADVAAERVRLQDWFATSGYELLQDDEFNGNLVMAAVNGEGEVIDLSLGSGGLLLKISSRDVSVEQQDAAELREGPGTAIVVLGGDSYELDGTCRIQGQNYAFEHFAPGGSTSANFQLDAFSQPAYGTAFFMSVEGSTIEQYTISVPTDKPDQPVITAGGSQFSISGVFQNMLGAGTVDGSFAVTCDR